VGLRLKTHVRGIHAMPRRRRCDESGERNYPRGRDRGCRSTIRSVHWSRWTVLVCRVSVCVSVSPVTAVGLATVAVAVTHRTLDHCPPCCILSLDNMYTSTVDCRCEADWIPLERKPSNMLIFRMQCFHITEWDVYASVPVCRVLLTVDVYLITRKRQWQYWITDRSL